MAFAKLPKLSNFSNFSNLSNFSKKFSALIPLRGLFLLRTSAKCTSALCPRFVVGSAFRSKRKTKVFRFPL